MVSKAIRSCRFGNHPSTAQYLAQCGQIFTILAANFILSMRLVITLLAAITIRAIATGPRMRILAFGDSLTEGWRRAFLGEEHYPYAKRLQELLDKAHGVGTVQVLYVFPMSCPVLHEST